MKGYVHSFESLAAVDGAGLRCAVFLGGCPLRCVYCHNPDTWELSRCRETEASALAAKIVRFKPYFGADGGVTFSGGEPLLQADFLLEVIPLLRESGVGYWVDTSGSVALTDSVKKVLCGADGILLDLKFSTEEDYRKYARGTLSRTLEMLEYLESVGVPTRIRTVVIPSINDSREALESYFAHIRGKSCVTGWELLGFHTLGFFKYEQLGVENPLTGVSPMDRDALAELQRFADECMRSR